ncbi:hypothetical protein Ddc_11633 [Ditylenchus destructor]|nr:hypothetical protein Ddc_11633 [Ditylenchus destructor]
MVCGKGLVNASEDIKTVSVLTSLEFIGPTETAPEAPDSPTSPEKRLLLRSSRPPRDQPSRRPAKQVGENYARRQQSRRHVSQADVNFKADFPLEYLTRPAAQFYRRAVSDPPWKTEEEPGLKRTEVDRQWTGPVRTDGRPTLLLRG